MNHAISAVNELNKEVYSQLHRNLLYQPTRRGKQLQNMTRDPIRMSLVLQLKIWNCQLMFPRYLYDSQFMIEFKRDFKKWWRKYYAFPGLPVEQVTIKIVFKTSRILDNFSYTQKPPREILTKMET